MEAIPGKIASAEEALSHVRDGSVIAVSGFNLATAPEYLIEKLYELYKETGHPKRLFLMSDAFPGSPGRGLDLIAKQLYEERDSDFLEAILMPYLGWSVWLQKMVADEMLEAYTWSIGVMAYWFREVGSGRPGLVTKVGLHTFFDPRHEGGFMNERAKKARRATAEVINVGGEEYLLYRAPKPEVALIRGSTADEIGNLTMEDEAMYGSVLSIAQAVKALPRKGTVVAQVERIARYGSLNPKEVVVPGPLVDSIVVAPPEKHWQVSSIQYDPMIAGRILPPPRLAEPVPLDLRKTIARRVLLEMARDIVELGRPIIVNLGIGIPSLVAKVALEEGVQDLIHVTIESGVWGGDPLYGPDFGAAIGPYAIIPMPDQFSIYEGGVIDAASLGFLQVDKDVNVNPSMLPGRIPGPGGFPVIVTGAPKLYYAGAFTAGKREIRVGEGRLEIRKDGDIVKFVRRVYKSFCACRRLAEGREIMFITERAVFRVDSEGLVLVEAAPGIDLEKDVLAKMEFKPKVSPRLDTMDERIFREGKMGVRDELLKAIRA